MQFNLTTLKYCLSMAVISFIFSGCATQKEVAENITTANVTSMYIDGAAFYKAYQKSSFILFAFDDKGGDNYDITSSSVSSTEVNATLNLQPTDKTKQVANNGDFSLYPSKISKKNIQKFIERLKSKDGIDFNKDNAKYIVNFQAQGIGGHGKNRYLRIGICLGTTTDGTCTSTAKLKSNPCPPCHNSYSSY